MDPYTRPCLATTSLVVIYKVAISLSFFRLRATAPSSMKIDLVLQMGSMATHKEVSQLELLEKRLSGVAELRYRMLYGKSQFITAFISATYTIHKESKHILTSKSPSQS
jgi:hypothetical protein